MINIAKKTGIGTITDAVRLEIFNEFTPNGDGQNETFQIDFISSYPNNTLEIYNRWGSLVYRKNNYDNSFIGVSNVNLSIQKDAKLPTGTYFYVLDLGNGLKRLNDWLYINR